MLFHAVLSVKVNKSISSNSPLQLVTNQFVYITCGKCLYFVPPNNEDFDFFLSTNVPNCKTFISFALEDLCSTVTKSLNRCQKIIEIL